VRSALNEDDAITGNLEAQQRWRVIQRDEVDAPPGGPFEGDCQGSSGLPQRDDGQ
jgi:hypothetical protein